MLSIDDARIARLAPRVQTSCASYLSPSFSFELALPRSCIEIMQIPEILTNSLAHLLNFEPIKALLTSDFADRDRALPIQGHRQFWSLHKHGPLDQPRSTARYRKSHDTDAGSALTFEGACPYHGAYQ